MPDKTPLVHILTPVYNGENFLAECIESVISQDYENWKYTIVDNASTDRTAEIIDTYRSRDPRIHVLRNLETVGALENHNIAVRAADPSSTYCKIQHADDRLLPGCISKMVAIGERYPTIGMIGSYSLWGTSVVCRGLPEDKEFFTGREAAAATLVQKANPFWSPSCLMHRTEAAREREYFYNEENLHADVQSDYEILGKWDFGFVHEELTYIRAHEDSRTSTLANPLKKTLATNLEMLIEYGPGFLEKDEMARQLDKQLNHYYQKLAVSFFELRGSEFWHFHRKSMRTVGHPLSYARLSKAIIVEFLSSPLRNLKRLVRWSLRRPAIP